MYIFQQKLKRIEDLLRKWNREEFGNIFRENLILEEQLSSLQQSIISRGRTSELTDQEGQLMQQLADRYK